MTPASNSTTTTHVAPQQQQPPYRLVCRIALEPTGDDDDAGVADEPLLDSRPAATPSCCESDAVVNFFSSCGATALIAIDVFAVFVLCVIGWSVMA